MFSTKEVKTCRRCDFRGPDAAEATCCRSARAGYATSEKNFLTRTHLPIFSLKNVFPLDIPFFRGILFFKPGLCRNHGPENDEFKFIFGITAMSIQPENVFFLALISKVAK